MKKKKGFTLVELLAVIVILAVILIIAVPRISEVINNSKKASFEATAKTIANQAEKKYMENEVLGKTGSFECSDVVKLNNTDYASCNITFDTNGNALVSITGSGKFAGLVINNATKNSATATELTETAAKYFSYEVQADGLTDDESKIYDVTVVDQSKCVAYFKNKGGTEEQATTLCSGGVVDGFSLVSAVKSDAIPASHYETAGLKVTSKVYDKGTITITGYNTEGGLDVVIPSIINGYKVIGIADDAFENKEIKSVVIPNTVRTIGCFAFAYNQIDDITFPTTSIFIYDNTFLNNPITNSGTYTYPDNVIVERTLE